MLCIGHRGAAGYELENSRASLEKAIALGVDMIELDVRAVGDELLVIHDESLDRVTNHTGSLASVTGAELRNVRLINGESLLFLREAICLVNRRVPLIIEIKDRSATKLLIAILADFLNNQGFSSNDFIICSFDHLELNIVLQSGLGIEVCPLLSGLPLDLARFGEVLGASMVSMNSVWVRREFVEDAHRRGIRVFVYTVNSEEDIRRMIELGVDGIISDYPDRVPRRF